MNTNIKHKLAELLLQRIETLGLSQKEMAARIGNITHSGVNHIVKKTWAKKANLVSDHVWNRIANYLGYQDTWMIVPEYKNFHRITKVCEFAQATSRAKAIYGEPGVGKSATLKEYANNYRNVFYIECEAHWTKKDFLNALKKALGLTITHSAIGAMVDDILDDLAKRRKALVIVDEIDKLRDDALFLFNGLYNKTLKQTGFVIAGGVYLKHRIDKGVHLNKQSYCELFSRIGGEFMPTHRLDDESIIQICQANGIEAKRDLKRVLEYAKGDLRRVETEVSNIRLDQAAKVTSNGQGTSHKG